jgi:hypothetical protein
LFPVGEEDPFANVSRLQASIEGKDEVFPLEDFDLRGEFGPIDENPLTRIEVLGMNGSDRVSWGFSPPLKLTEPVVKSTLFFSPSNTAVAHASPMLVDPDQGLAPAGIPFGLYTGSFRATMAHDSRYLYLELEVEDDRVVDNDQDWREGDLVVLVIDGLGDPQNEMPELILVFGSINFVVQLNTQGVQVIHDFNKQASGYTVFAAIQIDTPINSDSPGPDRVLQLGIEVRDLDDGSEPVVSQWPADWDDQTDPGDFYSYQQEGLGNLALKTRVLDAKRVSRNTVDFGPGIDEFLDSGAVPLNRAPVPGEDEFDVYALWDSTAIYFAIASSDSIFCTQERTQGDRDGLVRDDAVEVVLVKEDQEQSRIELYRAIFNLQGSIAYDSPPEGSWNPAEIYFRFDLDGPLPNNDCQEGRGYTFKVRIPWADMDYSWMPDTGEVFAFDLVVYDNDRGARSVAAFSPMGPSESPQQLGELRLFDY